MDTREAIRNVFEHNDEEIANIDDVVEGIISIIDTEAAEHVNIVLDMVIDRLNLNTSDAEVISEIKEAYSNWN